MKTASLISRWITLAFALLPLASAAAGATFGAVVPIGGQAADLALDEGRGLLYIANFTANRIEVMSTRDNSIRSSINVAAQPGSLAISPDGRYLVITHFGNWSPPRTQNGLTIIDLNSNEKRVFALGYTP